MKKIILFIVFAVCINANAQVVQDWSFATTAFNSNGLLCHSIATDSQGNVYQTGKTANSASSMYISKRNATGVILWNKQMSGIGFLGFYITSETYTIAIDASDNIYISGNVTNGSATSIDVDFDPGTAVVSIPIPSSKKVTFISKLTNDGNLIWAKQFNNTATIFENNDDVVSMKIDTLGNVYATGGFGSTVDFDPDAGVYNLIAVGLINNKPKQNIFILKLNATGNLVWAKSFVNQSPAIDTTYPDQGTSIDVDAAGNVYTIGLFTGGIDADPNSGTHVLSQLNTYGDSLNNILFVAKLDSNGDYVWANTFAEGHQQAITNIPTINVDGFGNLILQFNSVIKLSNNTAIDYDFGQGTQNLTVGNYQNASYPVILKIDTNSNFIWVKLLADTASFYTNAYCNQATVDAAGNIYSIGSFASGYNSSANTYGAMDFDPSAASFNMTSNGVTDIFLTKLDNNGNFLWANQIGGSGYEYAKSFAIGLLGKIIILGESGNGFNKLSTSTNAGIFMASYTQPALATQNFNLENTISVYPNPATNNVTISSTENLQSIAIYDILGKQIFTKTSNNSSETIDVSSFDNGVYFARILSENSVLSTIKIVKN